MASDTHSASLDIVYLVAFQVFYSITITANARCFCSGLWKVLPLARSPTHSLCVCSLTHSLTPASCNLLHDTTLLTMRVRVLHNECVISPRPALLLYCCTVTLSNNRVTCFVSFGGTKKTEYPQEFFPLPVCRSLTPHYVPD